MYRLSLKFAGYSLQVLHCHQMQYFIDHRQVCVLSVHTKCYIYTSKDLLAIPIRVFAKDILSAALFLCYILQTDYVTELYFSQFWWQFHFTRSFIHHWHSLCSSLTPLIWFKVQMTLPPFPPTHT